MATPNNLIQAIERWRTATLDALAGRFEQVMDKAIPTLMEQAEKARNNAVQSSYFQAQQELRRHHDAVCRRFTDTLAAGMAGPQISHATHQGNTHDRFDLVNPDLFERQVALQGLSERAEQQYYGLLHELGHRLSVVYGSAIVGASAIPASPKQLLQAFDAATQSLVIEDIARQALAIIYDHGLLRHMEPHYSALNDLLRDAGVLPNLKYEIVHLGSQKGRATRRAQPTQAATQDTAQQRIDTPSHKPDTTLDKIRDLMPGSATESDGTGVDKLASTDIADLIEAQNQALTALLPEHDLFSPVTSGIRIDATQLAATQQALRQQRQDIKREIGPERLSRYDESTIDIVGALFEAMLNEADLPSTIKALLSHLHTPYLKLAMREQNLLSDPEHPARQLLDELVSAGEVWGSMPDLGASIFPVLQEIVDNLRHGEMPSHGQIEQQRTLLNMRIADLRKRRDLNSSHITEAEVGRAKLEHAKELAETYVHLLLDDHAPCQACQDFLLGPWHDYLTLLLLRHDGHPGGEGWHESQELGRQIANLSRAVTSPNPPPKTALVNLREHLANGLGVLAPHYQSHIDALMQGMMEMRDLDRSEVPVHRPAAKPVPRVHAHKEATDEKVNDPVLASLVKELKQTPAGTTFRLPAPNGGEPRLVNMTWYNPQTNRLLFVDQRGAKADLLSAVKLARMIRDGHAQRMTEEKEPFITRALNTLKHYLEKTGVIKQGGEK